MKYTHIATNSLKKPIHHASFSMRQKHDQNQTGLSSCLQPDKNLSSFPLRTIYSLRCYSHLTFHSSHPLIIPVTHPSLPSFLHNLKTPSLYDSIRLLLHDCSFQSPTFNVLLPSNYQFSLVYAVVLGKGRGGAFRLHEVRVSKTQPLWMWPNSNSDMACIHTFPHQFVGLVTFP